MSLHPSLPEENVCKNTHSAVLSPPCSASRLVRQLGAVMTFGQPRTGDEEYAQTFNMRFGDRAFRYVCGCDMVRSRTQLFKTQTCLGYKAEARWSV